MSIEELYMKCALKAHELISKGYLVGKLSHESLTDLLIKLELEREEKNNKSDQLISYNDEIVSIEPMGELDTIDISVSGDNLFYCNNILTKNSFGLPATADIMLGIISTEELEEMNNIMIKQLKNRFSDINYYKRFVVGIDRSRMKLFDTENSAQEDIADAGTKDNKTMERNSKQIDGSKFNF